MSTQVFKIAIADDDAYFRRLLGHAVSGIKAESPAQGSQVDSFSNGRELLRNLAPDTRFLVLDYYLDGSTGEADYLASELIQDIQTRCPQCEIVVVSSRAPQLEATGRKPAGASRMLCKGPDTAWELRSLAHNAMRRYYQEAAGNRTLPGKMVG